MALGALIAGLKATLLSERVDRPVFYMLPEISRPGSGTVPGAPS